MNRIVLNGLNLDGFPLAALVAYGLLRVLDEQGVKARLGFEDAEYRPRAFLETNLSEEALLMDHLLPFALAYDQRRRGVVEVVEKEGEAGEQPKRRRARRKKKVLELKDLAAENRVSQIDPEFLLAYLAQLPRKKGPVTTPFDTTKGQQGFLKALGGVVELLRNDPHRTREAIQRVLHDAVLLSPRDRLFTEKIPRLGWHPTQFRRTADQARISNQEKDLETIRLNPAAVLLAWEALPLFPFPPGADIPLGFTREGGRYRLHLPTPSEAVELAVVRTLIALAPSLEGRAPDLAVWVSEQIGSKTSTDDYPCFLAAKPGRGMEVAV